MKQPDIASSQRLRLRRMMSALCAAASFTLVLFLLYWRDDLRLDAMSLSVGMLIFWLGNLSFVAILVTNANLHLRDPTMTFAMMLWATVSTFSWAYFVTEGRYLVIMMYLLAMMLGTFRLRLHQFLQITALALVLYAAIIGTSADIDRSSGSLITQGMNWFVFMLVMLGFSLLGGETSRLRATLQRRNRELREARDAMALAFEAKARFLASTSHELRTPLNAILGATDIIDSAVLKPGQHDALNRARYAGKHLLSLVNTMIDLSRIESGVLELRAQPMNLHDELHSLQSMMAPDAALRGIELTLDTQSLPTTPVMGDAMRIQEVLLHLLKLAITTARVPRVTVAARKLTDGGVISFSVSRAGAGEDEDAPTPRAGTDDVPEYENFSLDLCQTLVALMGGKLTTSGAAGEQARYEFELDMPQAQSTLPLAQDPDKRRTMLIVDDSIDNRMLLQAYLEDQPWDLSFAEDGLVAVGEARKQAFDLILMDMQMPRMNGIDATRTIRELERERPEWSAAKILAITANDSVNDHQRSLDAGCNEHLVKPISKKTLLHVIARTIATRH